MAITGQPQPIEPPIEPPAEGELESKSAASPRNPNERKQEKCRKMKIIRIYDSTGKYWVDVEVMVNASFKGSQWPGPDLGNQSQETILELVQKLTQDGKCGDIVKVGMDPSKPITPLSGAAGSGGASVDVPARSAMNVESRNNVNRKFANKNKIDCCKDKKRRVRFNEIGDEFLKDSKPSNGGSATPLPGTATPASSSNPAKMPPKSPKDYKNAIKASDDGADLWLDICIPDNHNLNRGKEGKRQLVNPANVWGGDTPKDASGNGPSYWSNATKDQGGVNVALPGSSVKVDPKGPILKLDPYQTVVNFGPDALAVEFYDGVGPDKKTT